LVLGCYGHLSDVDITFPDSPNMHIVLGANEAGKSTALAAIGDCLFRFPHRTPYAFLYATRDLRVGVMLQARDGRTGMFFRRKAREDLFDEQDRPLPESAIAAFLGGATRDRFDRVFGLNGIELRQGGNAILEGKGEVGEAVLGAHTGLHGFRDTITRLDAEAARLFGDRRGQRAFHKAAERFRQAHHDLQERRIDPAAWKQVQDELAALEQARVASAARARVLHTERSRLDRIRRTTPARLALVRHLADRETLGAIPDLPDDAPRQHQQAIAIREQADRDLLREQDRLSALETELNSLPENAPILALGEAIDALAADRQRIASALADREAQRLLAAQHEAAIEQAGRQLGLALDAQALMARIPSALDREAMNQVLRRHERLSGQQISAAERLGGAELRLQEAQAVLDALPMAEHPADLRAAIDAVKAEGRLDAELAQAERIASAAASDLARALAALPLWQRDAAALDAAPMPMEADLRRLGDALTANTEEVRRIDDRLAEHDRILAEYAAQTLADAASGELPTQQAIQVARDRRDTAWALIRRAFLEGGAPVSEAEREAAGLAGELGSAFEALIQAADRLADRRAAEQERVVAAEQRRAEQIRRQALRDLDEQARRAAVARLDAAQADWVALWQPCGIVPADPAVMREWMQKRTLVLTGYTALLKAERDLDSLRARHLAAFATLSALLPTETEAASGSLSALLRSAERICKDQEDKSARLAKAREAVESTAVERAKAAWILARVDNDFTAWRESWATAARSLSLPVDAAPELGSTALSLWSAIDTATRDRGDAVNRVEQMTVAIDAFRADAASVVMRIAPELDGMDSLEAVPLLAERLAAARQDARRRDEVMREAGQVRTAIAAARAQHQAAFDALDRLRQQAGAADEAALPDVLASWSAHRDLSAKIIERETELRGLDDGKTLAELAEEAEGEDFDSLPARIEQIDAELQLIHRADLTNRETTLGLERAQEEMKQGRDAAGSAQAMETALADMEDIASRYVPLRMAHILLRAGMDRFRRQQQRPLLIRAGQIFARLTEGRYDRLEVDEKDSGEAFVIACLPDGSNCPADRLSEGTLDQLYLALRLAAIETDARAAEPLPFIGDDLLVNFDDRRARAALRVLADFAASVTQVILFTHHDHIAAMAEPGLASAHRLSAGVPAASDVMRSG
jgi:uncharacterized protein YhaN